MSGPPSRDVDWRALMLEASKWCHKSGVLRNQMITVSGLLTDCALRLFTRGNKRFAPANAWQQAVCAC